MRLPIPTFWPAIIAKPMPPNNQEIERYCLSSLMQDAGDVRQAVASGLKASDFYLPINGLIFQAICACAVDGQIDAVAVWRAVNAGVNEKIDSGKILEISTIEPTSIRAGQFAQDVMALSRQRRVAALLSEAQLSIQKPAVDWAESWERLHPILAKVGEAGVIPTPRTTSTMINEAKEMIRNPLAGAMPGPWRSVDIDFGPIRAGDYVILAARPSVGKTALALAYAAKSAKDGKHAAIFSLEMRGPSLLVRLARMAARSVQPDLVLAALESLPRGLLHIFEADGERTLAQIEARIRLLNSTYPLGIVIVDYLGLVEAETGSKYSTREREVAIISRTFKNLAATLPCPLLLLHQINRQSEIHDRRPMLSDLRESGAIEQDADVVWFLNEDKTSAVAGASSLTVEWMQAKCRNGIRNVICKMNFCGPIFTFDSIL